MVAVTAEHLVVSWVGLTAEPRVGMKADHSAGRSVDGSVAPKADLSEL